MKNPQSITIIFNDWNVLIMGLPEKLRKFLSIKIMIGYLCPKMRL